MWMPPYRAHQLSLYLLKYSLAEGKTMFFNLVLCLTTKSGWNSFTTLCFKLLLEELLWLTSWLVSFDCCCWKGCYSYRDDLDAVCLWQTKHFDAMFFGPILFFFNFALVLDMPGWLVAIAKAERNRIHCAIKKRPAKPYNFLLLSAFSSAPAAEFITSHNLSGSFQVSTLYDKRGQYVTYLFFQKFDLRKQQKWQRD